MAEILKIFRCSFIILIMDGIVDFGISTAAMATFSQPFQIHGIVPDILQVAPTNLVQVIYPSGVEVKEGNELTPTQVKDVPTVKWEASPDKFYTLAMTDPDAPSRADPKYREWQHWMVVNIPGNNLDSGQTLTAYVGAGPPQDTGLHRYVFIVYEQPGQIDFNEKILTNTSSDNRTMFSISKFAAKYGLGDPIAGNLFQAQYDDYVPILFQQLAGNVKTNSASLFKFDICLVTFVLIKIAANYL